MKDSKCFICGKGMPFLIGDIIAGQVLCSNCAVDVRKEFEKEQYTKIIEKLRKTHKGDKHE